jgi:4-hydroxy-tetrahydrodipicolinate synthase
MLKGCFPALVTPMKEDTNRLNHEINFDAFKQLINRCIENGVDGIVPAGCTGHAASLTHDEQINLIEKAIEFAKNRVIVIGGTGSNCTREAINLAQKAEQLGVKTHLQISPYQNKPTQEGIYQHYKTIAEVVDGDIIVYNVPGRTGKNVEADTVIGLAKDFDNIIAVKEASGNLEQIKKIIEGTKDLKNFSVLSGDDSLTLEIIKSGGKGVISVATNVDPKRVSQMVHLALNAEVAKAEELNKKLSDLFKNLFIETNPGPAHYCLRKIGISVGVPRLPLVDVKEENKKIIDETLGSLGLI